MLLILFKIIFYSAAAHCLDKALMSSGIIINNEIYFIAKRHTAVCAAWPHSISSLTTLVSLIITKRAKLGINHCILIFSPVHINLLAMAHSENFGEIRT